MANTRYSKGLGIGLTPLAYMGVNPTTPNNFIIESRPPTVNDVDSPIGTLWLDYEIAGNVITVSDLYLYCGFSAGVAVWKLIVIGNVNTVTGGIDITITGTVANPIVNLKNVYADANGDYSRVVYVDAGGYLCTSFDPTPSLNQFLGGQAGISTTGHRNTFIGAYAGRFIGASSNNVAIGASAFPLNDDLALGNIAIGVNAFGAGFPGVVFNHSIGIGDIVGIRMNGGIDQIVAIGSGVLNWALTASEVVSVGAKTMNAALNPVDTTTVGTSSLNNAVQADNNSCLGHNALGVATGIVTDTIAIGKDAGSAQTVDCDSNIYIGNVGVDTEAHVTRIGTYGIGAGRQNACYIAGIYGSFVVGATLKPVYIDSAGHLGTGNSSGSSNTFYGYLSDGTVTTATYCTGIGFNTQTSNSVVDYTTSVGAATLPLLTGGAGYNTTVGSFSMNQSITSENCTSIGANSLQIATGALRCTAAGAYALTSLLTGSDCIAVGFQAGQNYTTNESSNIVIGNLGTIGDANVIRIGTDGGGAGQQDACYVAGIYGAATTNGLTVVVDNTGKLGTTGLISSVNTFYGTNAGAGNTGHAGVNNSGFGYASLFTNQNTNNNTAEGFESLYSLAAGGNDTVIGEGAMQQAATASSSVAVGYHSLTTATTSNYNTALGASSLNALVTGNNNIALGYLAGALYIGNESSNIVIGNPGTIGDANVIRIGDTGGGVGQQNQCFIAGITGVTPATPPIKSVVIDSNGQLGTSSTYPSTLVGLNNVNLTAYNTGFIPFFASNFDGSNNVNNSQIIAPATGTIYKLYVNVFNNSGSTAGCTVSLNINAVDTALSVTIPAGLAGNYSDLVHEIAVTAGDAICISAACTDAVHNVTANISILYAMQ